MSNLQYLRTHEISGFIHLLTGMRIGGGKETVEIGGIDNPVIKNPYTQYPYIPGSSLKGKLRSTMEWALNVVEPDGSVYGSDARRAYDAADPILRTFGTTHKSWTGGPTRLIVRDSSLKADWIASVLGRGLPLTEEKMEVSIDRLKGKAKDGGLRTSERVPAGAVFAMEMSFREYSLDGDEGARDRHCLNMLLQGLKLLEKDALGSSGSRGYGRIEFQQLMLNGRSIQQTFAAIDRFEQIPSFDVLQN